MDAKSKAEFINSVAVGKALVCKKCGAANEPDSMFCISCGAALKQEETKTEPAFGQAKEEKTNTVAPVTVTAYDEPEAFFADGLPDWDIVPPQVVVRRRQSGK